MDEKNHNETKGKFGKMQDFWKKIQGQGTSGASGSVSRSATKNRKGQSQGDEQTDGMRDGRPEVMGTLTPDIDGIESAFGGISREDYQNRSHQESNTSPNTTGTQVRRAESWRRATRSLPSPAKGTLQLKIDAAKRAFVETNIFKQAKHKLQKYGHLTLSGVSGEGKTTTALVLADHFQKHGYSTLFIDNTDDFEIDNYVNSAKRIFIIFDDVFGTVGTPVNIGQVRTLLNNLKLHMENDRDAPNELMDSSDEMLEDTTESRTTNRKKQKRRQKDIMVVFTSRSYILEETLRKLQDHSRNLFRRESRMDLSKKGEFNYSHVERKQILMNIKELYEHEFDENFDIDATCKVYQQIFGFPLICKLYFENANFQKDASDFFMNPLLYLRRELEEIIQSKDTKPGMAAALILPLLCDGKVSLAEFESRSKTMEDRFNAIKALVPNVSVPDIRQCVKTFSGTFLESKKDIVTFTHSSIYDACACALFNMWPMFVLQNCSLKFLKERVQHQAVENTSIDDQLQLIYLSEPYHKAVVLRLADGIQHGEIKLTFSHSVLRKQENVDLLLNNVTLDLSQTDTGKRVLYWAVHSGSCYLVERLLQKYDLLSLENVISEAIVAAASTGAAEIMRFFKGKFPDCFTSDMLNRCLLVAATNNKHKIVDYLVTIGAVGNVPDEDGQNILHIACRNDNYDIVTTVVPLFEKLPSSILNAVDNQGYSPIMIAAMNGNKHIFETFFQSKNINLKQEDSYGDSLIHHACKGGTISIVKKCLPHFNINTKGNCGWTPIMIAASSGNKGLFDLLVKHKADLRVIDDDDNCLLHHASVGDNRFIIESLLPQFDINIKGADGATPVTFAVGLRKSEALEFLLSKKPDLTIKMKGGNTLLHLACQCGSTSIVRTLLPKFDINIRGEHNWTPLMKAAVKGNEHVFECLIKENADVNLTDKYGENILHLACQGGSSAIVKYLMPKFNVDCRGNHLWTPIMKAVICNHTKIFNLLSDKSDLQLVDAFGDSLLHFACEKGNTEVVKRLLFVIDINTKGKQGWTPIMEAAVNGHSEVFRLLFDRGADTSQNTFEGDSLLHLACHGGKIDIVECLLLAHNREKRGKDGLTPVMIAALNGHEKLFSFLMKGSPDTSVLDRFGDHLLNIASRGGSDIIVKELISGHGFDKDKRGKDGLSPIMVSALHGNTNVFVFLLKQNAKTIFVDFSGNSLIHIACKGGNANIVRQVITPENTNEKGGEKGWTPIMTAVAYGQKGVFDLLMRCKADMKALSLDGETLLTIAKKGGNAKIVKTVYSELKRK